MEHGHHDRHICLLILLLNQSTSLANPIQDHVRTETARSSETSQTCTMEISSGKAHLL